jgi:Arc/MetJ-type ribon-helix-helix transcriptional regulator
MASSLKKVGRPRGAPSKVLPVRIPEGLIDRLDRYLEWAERRTGQRANRNEAIRQALTSWLEAKEEIMPSVPQSPLSTPEARQQWRAAYNAVGQGEGFVRLHRIREALGWSGEEFDRVLETLVAGYHVELHGGDPSQLSAAEVANSYQDARGALYLTVSWRNP